MEVCLFFRIDGDSDNADVFINYQTVDSDNSMVARGGVKHGVHIRLKSEDVSWLRDAISSRGTYGRISGLGLENGDHVPLLQQTFSLDEPLALVKVRAQKKLGPIEYEQHDGPCPGLLIWVQKKTGPSTDLPKRIWTKPDAANR